MKRGKEKVFSVRRGQKQDNGNEQNVRRQIPGSWPKGTEYMVGSHGQQACLRLREVLSPTANHRIS